MREIRSANGPQTRTDGTAHNIPSVTNFSPHTQVPFSFSSDHLDQPVPQPPPTGIHWANSQEYPLGYHPGYRTAPSGMPAGSVPGNVPGTAPPTPPPKAGSSSDRGVPPSREDSPLSNHSHHSSSHSKPSSPFRDVPPHFRTVRPIVNPPEPGSFSPQSSEIAQLSSLIQSLIITLQNQRSSQPAGVAIPSLHNTAPVGLGHFPYPPVTPSSQNSAGMGVPNATSIPPYSTVPIPYQQFSQPQSQHHSPLSPHESSADMSLALLRSLIHTPVPSLPSTTSIPLLQGRLNFAQWQEAAVGMVQNLGLNSWICGPSPPNLTTFNPDVIPVYPPLLSTTPSVSDCQLWHVFWTRDGIAAQILMSRLSQSVAAMLPPSTDPVTYQRRTARDVLNVLRARYGVGDFARAALLKDKLWQKQAYPGRIVDYVTEWRTDLNQLHSVDYQIHWGEAITRFLAMLPNDIIWQSIRNFAMTETSVDPTTLDRGSWEYFADLVLQTDSNNTIRESARSSTYASQHAANRNRPNVSRGGDTSNTRTSTTTNTRDRQPNTPSSNQNSRSTSSHPQSSNSTQPRPQAHLAQVDSQLPSETDIDHTVDESINTADVNSDIQEAIEESFQAYSSMPPDTPPGWLYTFAAESPLVLSAFIRDYQGILDSGSSKHLFNSKQLFWDFNPKERLSIGTANCGSLETHGKGIVKIRVSDVR
ncbi:hypothetical protein VNI00_004671 [Paramarasmius palmivorus]|uniref:Retrovirus-related Pol polyprotein from transposon TNT 1-94-like beta-barrel domain-containing protein n=1 Tax=Paramarasmius palmivorus TaxID=297713 RepID=A0AAW0DEQ4_9AGAR